MDEERVAGAPFIREEHVSDLGNCDPKRDALLRFEQLRPWEIRVFVLLTDMGSLCAFLLLTLLFYINLTQDMFALTTNWFAILHLVLSAIFLAAAASLLIIFLARLLQNMTAGRKWSIQRVQIMAFMCSQLAAMVVLDVCWLLPSLYLLWAECGYFDPVINFSAFVRWSALYWVTGTFVMMAISINVAQWQKGEQQALLYYMKPMLLQGIVVFVLWALSSGTCLTKTILMTVDPIVLHYDADTGGCMLSGTDCVSSPGAQAVRLINPLLCVLWCLLYLAVIYITTRRLKRLPYTTFRMANLLGHLQIRQVVVATAVVILSSTLLSAVNFRGCTSQRLTWISVSLPVAIIFNCVALSNGCIFMPRSPGSHHILLDWLYEFSWTEAALERTRAARNAQAPDACWASEQPMFCFETAIKTLEWSKLVYNFDEEAGGTSDLHEALAMYDLDNFEIIHERHKCDVRVMLGYSDNTMVMAFRGTASMKNALFDLKAWPVLHPPARRSRGGMAWLWRQAPVRVHSGFLACWTSMGLSNIVMERAEAIVQAAKDPASFRIIITGHSLGGALATLAASDLAARLNRNDLQCYTFGAPYTGNHAFASEFDQRVPDAWTIINNQDVVTSTGRFMWIYKKPGKKALLDGTGQIIVRPSTLDYKSRVRPGGSIANHLLEDYSASLLAVVMAQFQPHRLAGGLDGVLQLSTVPFMRDFMEQRAVNVEQLTRSARMVLPDDDRLKELVQHWKKAYKKQQGARGAAPATAASLDSTQTSNPGDQLGDSIHAALSTWRGSFHSFMCCASSTKDAEHTTDLPRETVSMPGVADGPSGDPCHQCTDVPQGFTGGADATTSPPHFVVEVGGDSAIGASANSHTPVVGRAVGRSGGPVGVVVLRWVRHTDKGQQQNNKTRIQEQQ